MRHMMRTKRDSMNLSMVIQSLRINWDLILRAYYSTRNGFIIFELCCPSGSLMYCHYYRSIYISKIANFLGFTPHKTTIGTELDNLNTIENQFKIAVRTIGILIVLIK